MIAYLEGRILHFEADSIVLLVGQVGYEVLVSPGLMAILKDEDPGQVSLFIYTHQTERQPKPVLIGFKSLEDKAFFQTFLTVDAIGPMKAVKALNNPVCQVALAIENKDTGFLTRLPGVGKRTAEKIIATLNGKVGPFAAQAQAGDARTHEPVPEAHDDISLQVMDVLTEQLGHSPASAGRMVKEAFERNPSIASAEALFDEIYQEAGR